MKYMKTSQQEIKQLIQRYAEWEVPAHTNLWPAMRAELEALSKAKVQNSRPQRRPRSALAAGIVVALLATAMGLPAASWILQQRFGMVLTPSRLFHLPAPGATPWFRGTLGATPGPYLLQPISLEEAQRQVPFLISQPTWLPEGLQLQGALLGQSGFATRPGESLEEAKARAPIQVSLFYHSISDVGKSVSLQITHGKPQGGYGYPAIHVQQAAVNSQPAAYVHGAWNEKNEWNPSADASALSWEAGGFTYLLRQYQLGLSQDDMMRIAESIR